MAPLFRHRLRVRYQECDPQNVVYFARYLDFCDIALTELWRERFGGYGAMVDAGSDIVVAEANLRYRAAAHFDDEIDVDLVGLELGTTSTTMRWEIRCGDTLLIEGCLRQVFIVAGTRDKKPMPDHVRAGLEAVGGRSTPATANA